jgi:hypothetical protein
MPRRPWGERCTAHRTNGTPCGAWAIRGGFVCRMHGGSAPQVRAAAHRRLWEEWERRQLERWERMSQKARDERARAFLPMIELPRG